MKLPQKIKELLDEIEVIFDYNLSLHKPEGRKQLGRVVSQVETLVRKETLEEAENELGDYANKAIEDKDFNRVWFKAHVHLELEKLRT